MRLRARKKCEGFPIGISIPSSPRMGAAAIESPFGRTFVIALPADLIFRFRSYLADFPNIEATEAAGCESMITEYESLIFWSRSASTSRQD